MAVPAKVRAYFKDADFYVSEQLKEKCKFLDPEKDHRMADQILLELLENLGFYETVNTFKGIDRSICEQRNLWK